jgi:uncharacterized protein (DUF169 family)
MIHSTSYLQETLGLSAPPIAIGFSDQPPAGLEKWQGGAVPAGCAFWREALNGRSFYTVPADHYNCAVGAYTHAIGLPAERGSQLEDTLNLMVSSEYLLMKEVPGIPVLPKTPAYISYAPVAEADFPYDVVLMAAKPMSAMLIYEAALRFGAASALTNALGRPACAVLPLATNTGVTALSLGCMGNRTFAALPADEMYVCIPGRHWEGFVSKVGEISNANCDMREFYQERKAQFATA